MQFEDAPHPLAEFIIGRRLAPTRWLATSPRKWREVKDQTFGPIVTETLPTPSTSHSSL